MGRKPAAAPLMFLEGEEEGTPIKADTPHVDEEEDNKAIHVERSRRRGTQRLIVFGRVPNNVASEAVLLVGLLLLACWAAECEHRLLPPDGAVVVSFMLLSSSSLIACANAIGVAAVGLLL